MDDHKKYLNLSNDVSLFDFYDYCLNNKKLFSYIFSFFLLLAVIFILFNPNVPTYNLIYKIDKNENIENYKDINIVIEDILSNSELFNKPLKINSFNPNLFFDYFYFNLNDKLTLYKFLFDFYREKKSEFDTETEYNTYINSIASNYKFSVNTSDYLDRKAIILEIKNQNIDSSKELASKYVNEIREKTKKYFSNYLEELDQVYRLKLEKKRNEIINRINLEKEIAEIEKGLIIAFLEDNEMIARSVNIKNPFVVDFTNTDSQFNPAFNLENDDSEQSNIIQILKDYGLSNYYFKGYEVLSKEIGLLKNQDMSHNLLMQNIQLVELDIFNENLLTDIKNRFQEKIVKENLINFSENLYTIENVRAISNLQIFFFIIIAGFFISLFILSISLAFKRSISK